MGKVFIGRLDSVSFNFDKKTVTLRDKGDNQETHSAVLTSTDIQADGYPVNRSMETLNNHEFVSTNGMATITAYYKDGTVTTATWNEAQ